MLKKVRNIQQKRRCKFVKIEELTKNSNNGI